MPVPTSCRGMLLSGLLLAAATGPVLKAAPSMEEVCARSDVQLPALGPGALLLFGEMHGSVQAPAFFLGAVCTALRDRTLPAVLVGLELPLDQQVPMARFLESEGSAADRAALLGTAFWSRDDQDGRSSAAMFDLVDALRRLRRADPRLLLVVFDDRSGDATGQRERMMARAWDSARTRHPDALSLALTGNLHAKRSAGFAGNADFRPMAMHVAEPVASFAFRGNGGRIWACMDEGCREYDQPPNAEARDRPDWRMRHVAPSRHYDGLIDLGAYTASPPAVAVYTTASGR